MRAVLASVVMVLVSTGSAFAAAPDPVVVFLERNGAVVEMEEGDVRIPKFGGGDRAWSGIVGCVADHFSPFQIEIVDRKPARGEFITAVVGGRASLLGLDDETTNGVGPYDGNVLRTARVFVFSKVSGERDVANLCAVTAHEVAHSLGLDHSTTCGDIMSYHLDACGTRRFLDVDGPCGEGRDRMCGTGDESQNSFRRLGALVGFKAPPEADDEPDADFEDEGDDEVQASSESNEDVGAPSDPSTIDDSIDDSIDDVGAPSDPSTIDDPNDDVAAPADSHEPEHTCPTRTQRTSGSPARPHRRPWW